MGEVILPIRFPADKLNNRRACSALQGIGGRATNKQDAKSTTLALLATIVFRPFTLLLRAQYHEDVSSLPGQNEHVRL